jgi:hypothetical protein
VRRLRFALIGAALAYFFDPDNGTARRKAATKRLSAIGSGNTSRELDADLAGHARETK